MPAQFRNLGKAQFAMVTLVGFLSRVDAHVSQQIATLVKALVAVLANVRPLSGVQAHVVPQRTRIGQFFIALWTLDFGSLIVWFFCPMDFPVDT